MTEQTPELIINEKVKLTKKILPPLDLKKDLSTYGSQEAFDNAVKDLLEREYVPFTTESSKGDFALFMIQKFTHKRKILLLIDNEKEKVTPKTVGSLKMYFNTKDPESEEV